MRIDQAVFGEARSGHDLLAASGAKDVAHDMVHRTDLPDQVPPGVDLPPYWSGFPVRQHFAFTRTAPDATAVRPGMMRTHALLLAQDDVRQVEDIAPLLNLLRAGPPPATDLAPLDLQLRSSGTHESSLLLATASALTDGAATLRRRSVVVACDIVQFEKLVTALWARLPPDLRERFYFRVSFSRRDLDVQSPPHLVWTPSRARWAADDLLTEVEPTSPSKAALYLSGEPDPELPELAAALELALDSFDRIVRLGQILDHLSAADPAAVAASIRLAAQLQPDASIGVAGKTRLVDALAERIAQANPSSLMPLRNLDLTAFAGAGQVWAALAANISTHKFGDGDLELTVSLLRNAATNGAAVEDWRIAVWDGLSAISDAGAKVVARAIVETCLIDPVAGREAIRKWRRDTSRDRALAANLQNRSTFPEADVLLDALASAGWVRAHAAAAAKTLGLDEAVERQLALEKTDEGLSVLLAATKPAKRIGLAVRLGDPRLVAAAAVAAAEKPGSLVGLDGGNRNVQAIWAGALKITAEAWSAPDDPVGLSRSVFSEVIEGRPVADGLVVGLSTSPLADISDWDGRRRLWSKLDSVSKTNFFSATAKGWLRGLEAGVEHSPPEPELTPWIVDPDQLDPVLRRWAADRNGAAVTLFQTLPELAEGRFQDWVAEALDTETRIPSALSSRIGELVYARCWTDTAHRLLNAMTRGSRDDLRPAVVACAGLLGWYDRWLHNIKPISVEERWEILLALATRLYGGGPEQDEVWERAGGKRSTLRRGGTGQSQWRHALNLVRSGCPVTGPRLVREMLRDYPVNDELKRLTAFREFGGHR